MTRGRSPGWTKHGAICATPPECWPAMSDSHWPSCSRSASAIGGTGAVFSLVNAVLLKTLPYREPARIVVIGEGNARGDVAPVNYALLTSHNEAFASIAAISGLSATLNGDRPEKIAGAARHAQLLRPARRGSRARARVSRRRGQAGCAACGHTEPWLLARPLRRRPGHRRSRPAPGQLACHRGWRHARRISVPRRRCRFVDACGISVPSSWRAARTN